MLWLTVLNFENASEPNLTIISMEEKMSRPKVSTKTVWFEVKFMFNKTEIINKLI